MARPRKNNLLYFSHDADASDHPKFIALRAHYGAEKGRAMEQRFWQLNGMIAKSEGCRLDLKNGFAMPSIAEKLELSISELDEFLSFLADPKKCDLINNKDGVIWTDRCDQELELLRESLAKDRERKKSGENIPPEKSGKPEFSNGNQTENQDIPGGKQELSGGIPPEKGGFPGREPASQPLEPLEPASQQKAAAALSLQGLKDGLAAAHVVLTDDDAKTVLASLLLKSAATEGCLKFLLAELKSRKTVKFPSLLLKDGVSKYGWVEKWKTQQPTPRFIPDLHRERTPEEEAQVSLEAAKAKQRMHMPLTDEDRKILGLPPQEPVFDPEEDTFPDDIPGDSDKADATTKGGK